MQAAGSATIVECICPDPTSQSARKHAICGGVFTGLGAALGGFSGNLIALATTNTYTGLIAGFPTGSCVGCLAYTAYNAYQNDGCSIRCRRITEASVACQRHLPVTNQPVSAPVLEDLPGADENSGSCNYSPIISMQPPPYREIDTLTAPADPPPPYRRNNPESDGQEETFV